MLNMKPRPSKVSIFAPSTAGEIFLSNAAAFASSNCSSPAPDALHCFFQFIELADAQRLNVLVPPARQWRTQQDVACVAGESGLALMQFKFRQFCWFVQARREDRAAAGLPQQRSANRERPAAVHHVVHEEHRLCKINAWLDCERTVKIVRLLKSVLHFFLR